MFEVWDSIKILKRKKNKCLAIALDELEQILDPNTKEFRLARKLFLDSFNDYYRCVFRVVLGIEVEGQEYL